MAEWHWYCGQHGQIDRSVQVRQYGSRAEGRCRTCGIQALWADRNPAPNTRENEQLALFGDRS